VTRQDGSGGVSPVLFPNASNGPTDALTPVPKASLGQLAADGFMRALETGAIPVGSRLVESRLAAMLGVSRGPVRDALHYLEQQGLVRRLPHRGSFAAAFAPEDLADVFILRAELEALAACLAVARGPIRPKDLAALRQQVDAMAAAVRSRRFGDLLDLDMAFHRMLAERSQHRRLVAILDGLRVHTRIAIALANKNVRALAGVVQTHRDVIAALESRDLHQVDRESKRHVLETLDYLGLHTSTLSADRGAVMISSSHGPARARVPHRRDQTRRHRSRRHLPSDRSGGRSSGPRPWAQSHPVRIRDIR
jgi:DNA-binding GntR family transcriptional regulator